MNEDRLCPNCIGYGLVPLVKRGAATTTLLREPIRSNVAICSRCFGSGTIDDYNNSGQETGISQSSKDG